MGIFLGGQTLRRGTIKTDIEVRLILNNEIVATKHFGEQYKKARLYYLYQTSFYNIYTQLVVDGEIYKTAAAEKFFGGRERKEFSLRRWEKEWEALKQGEKQ